MSYQPKNVFHEDKQPLPIAYPSTIKEAIYAQEREFNVEIHKDSPIYQVFYHNGSKIERRAKKTTRLTAMHAALLVSERLYGTSK